MAREITISCIDCWCWRGRIGLLVTPPRGDLHARLTSQFGYAWVSSTVVADQSATPSNKPILTHIRSIGAPNTGKGRAMSICLLARRRLSTTLPREWGNGSHCFSASTTLQTSGTSRASVSASLCATWTAWQMLPWGTSLRKGRWNRGNCVTRRTRGRTATPVVIGLREQDMRL